MPDKCERCKGGRGGVRGNENLINGKALCDYCAVDVQNVKEIAELKSTIRLLNLKVWTGDYPHGKIIAPPGKIGGGE